MSRRLLPVCSHDTEKDGGPEGIRTPDSDRVKVNDGVRHVPSVSVSDRLTTTFERDTVRAFPSRSATNRHAWGHDYPPNAPRGSPTGNDAAEVLAVHDLLRLGRPRAFVLVDTTAGITITFALACVVALLVGLAISADERSADALLADLIECRDELRGPVDCACMSPAVIEVGE